MHDGTDDLADLASSEMRTYQLESRWMIGRRRIRWIWKNTFKIGVMPHSVSCCTPVSGTER